MDRSAILNSLMIRSFIVLTLMLIATSVARAQGAGPDDPTIEARIRQSIPDLTEAQRYNDPRFSRAPRPAVVKANFAITNDSLKKIKVVTWECTLIDPNTMKTMARYTIVTKKKIAPQKDAVLTTKLEVPMVVLLGRTVSADKLKEVGYGPPRRFSAIQVNKIREIEFTEAQGILCKRS
jgi:hypothetical protein